MSHPRTVNGDDPGTFRVLSIDGGGIRGTYAAAFLAGLEEMTTKRVVDHFDLIVGTSTGGIIALALGMGVPAPEILRFYVEKGPRIFPLTDTTSRLKGMIRQISRAKHAPEILRDALSEVLGSYVLGDSLTRLVIPAFDGSSGDVHLFKTAHSPRFKRDHSTPAVDVGLATSAAPTFLPAFVGPHGTTLVDGGVWANCPAAVAVIEALTVLRQPMGSVDLLTVGTTDEPLHIPERRAMGGLLRWMRFAPTFLMQAQSQAALAHAKLLTQGRLVRISQSVAPNRFSLDDPTGIPSLRALGTKAARHHEAQLAPRYLAQKAEPFIPFRGPRSPESAGELQHRG